MYSWAIVLSLSALILSSSALIMILSVLITLPSWLVYLTYHRQCQWCNFKARSPSGFHLFVCMFVCLSSKALQVASLVRSSWSFLQKMSSGHATMQNFFFWKSDKGQGQGHHFCEKQIMGHNFWTGSDRDFWLVAERSPYNSASVRDAPIWRATSSSYVTWL